MSNLVVATAVDLFMQSITQANMRSTLGLGDSSTRNVGVSAGTVSAGDDSRIVGAVQTGSSAALASLTLTSPLAAIYGGTGQSGYSVGEILYANSTTTLSRLSPGLAGTILTSNGASAPSWGSSISVSTATVTGTGTAPYFRVVNTGVSLDARMGSSFNSSLFGIGTVSAHDVSIQRGNVQVGLFTSGGFNGVIGATTPAAGTFTTLASNSNANIRTTKNNFHITVNVKDYGAIGDGSTDDTAAINSAIAALTNYSTLLFPSGDYKITAGLTSIDGLSHVSVVGQGARIHNTTTGASGNTFVCTSASTFISFTGLSLVGSATVRGSGIHIRLYSSYSSVQDCYFEGCSDFGVHISSDSGGFNVGSRVENNTFNTTLGDGVHAGNAEDFVINGNVFTFTGDDAIGIVADDPTRPPARGVVSNNQIFASGSAGVRIDEASDIQVNGNNIITTVQSAIYVGRFTSTTAHNTRISITGNKIYNSTTTPGPRAAIWVNFANDTSISNNDIEATANGGSIVYLDVNNLTVKGNVIKGSPVRAIASDDTTTANVAATWSGVMIQNNAIQSVTANEAIYCVPASGKTITNLLIDGNVCNSLPSGDYIFYARVTTGVIANNVSRDNRTVSNGGTVSGVSEYNNNVASSLGTMASQNANAVAITGGTISGLSVLASNGTLAVAGNSNLANLIVKSSQINEYSTNALASIDFNYDGYFGGTTQFRNINIYDGKNALVATFTGSTKALAVVGAISASNASFTTALPVSSGGTGQSSYTNGQLLIGNTTGNTLAKATLTGTSNQISISNGAGSITLSTPQDIATSSTPQFLRMGIGTGSTTSSDLIISRSTPPSSAQASVVVSGNLTAAYDLHPNAFRDVTSFTPTVSGDAYAAFDAQQSMGGTVALNHFNGFQARHGYSGTNTLGLMSGFATTNMGLSGTGTITFLRGLYVQQATISGGGTVGQFDGIYMDALTNSTGNVNAIYIAGANRIFSAGGQIVTSQDLTPPAGATAARGAFTFDQSSQTGLAVMNRNSTATGRFVDFCRDGGGIQGSITQTNNTTVAYNTSSDARLKENIRDIADSGDIIDSIRPRIFDWKWSKTSDEGKDAHGFIAQELYDSYPCAVRVGNDEVNDNGDLLNPWGIDFSKLIPVLTAEIKALRQRIAALET